MTLINQGLTLFPCYNLLDVLPKENYNSINITAVKKNKVKTVLIAIL